MAVRDDDTSPGIGPESGEGTLGRIALKQVRVKRPELEERRRDARGKNPGNALVPYLDLFCRLDDAELARLAGTNVDVVAQLRSQVDEINTALERYVDLLPRLSDNELRRLTGASSKTIRFWRLCQPRTTRASTRAASASVPRDSTPDPRVASVTKSRHTESTSGVHTPGVPSEIGVSRTPPPADPPDDAEARAPVEEIVTEVEETGEHEPVRKPPEEDDLAFELSDEDFY